MFPLLLFQDSEHKGFMDKLYAIQDVFISVQSALDEVASYGERIKKWVSHRCEREAIFLHDCASAVVFMCVPFLQHGELDSAFSQLVVDHCLMFGHVSSLPRTSSIPCARVG